MLSFAQYLREEPESGHPFHGTAAAFGYEHKGVTHDSPHHAEHHYEHPKTGEDVHLKTVRTVTGNVNHSWRQGKKTGTTERALKGHLKYIGGMQEREDLPDYPAHPGISPLDWKDVGKTKIEEAGTFAQQTYFTPAGEFSDKRELPEAEGYGDYTVIYMDAWGRPHKYEIKQVNNTADALNQFQADDIPEVNMTVAVVKCSEHDVTVIEKSRI